METNSHPEAVASTVKQGQYSPRKRKDTAPKVNPQLAIELFFQEMGRIEAYTKRIEDATSRKVQIDALNFYLYILRYAIWQVWLNLLTWTERALRGL